MVEAFGSKDHAVNGFWDQGPQILGIWTQIYNEHYLLWNLQYIEKPYFGLFGTPGFGEVGVLFLAHQNRLLRLTLPYQDTKKGLFRAL